MKCSSGAYLVILIAVSGCMGDVLGGGSEDGASTFDGNKANSTEAEAGADGNSTVYLPGIFAGGNPVATQNCTGSSDPQERCVAEVCGRWNDSKPQQPLSPPIWSGDVNTCSLGTFRDRALTVHDTLKRINAYRWLVGVRDDIVEAPEADRGKFQSCAVMQAANMALSHNPGGSGWSKCVNEAAAAGAGSSNLAGDQRSPAASVEAFMFDSGQWPHVGHRRWILNQELTNVGIGFAFADGAAALNGFSCLGVFYFGGARSRPWHAYPNPGPAPFETGRVGWHNTPGNEHADGFWSFHSHDIRTGGSEQELRDAVEVRRVRDDALMPIKVGYSEWFAEPALVWTWTTAADIPQSGESYQVTIKAVSGAPITYRVDLVDCG